MPRLFGNSPSSSHRKQQQQNNQQQEESRRRSSFAFLKHSPDRRTNSSMRRSREHAKQIALQLSEQSPSPPTTTTTTAQIRRPQPQRQQPTPLFVDFQAFPATTTPSPTNIDNAYNMNDIQMHEPSRKGPISLDAFVEEEEQRHVVQDVVSSPRSSVSTSESTTSSAAASNQQQRRRQGLQRSSMPTFPSNSSMQSKNVSSLTSSTAGSGGGAASRRRQRAKQQHQTKSFSSSKSDVHVDYYHSLEEQPTSPSYPLSRSGSASKANHLVHYAQTPRRARVIAPSPPPSNRSLQSQWSVHSYNDVNAGFSFDAFGLDESQVDQEVHQALTDLVQGGSRPDLQIFLQQRRNADDDEQEFSTHNFDTASSSRGSGDDAAIGGGGGTGGGESSVTHSSELFGDDNADEVGGLDNGFRVVAVKQSPTSSERSSLTSAGTSNEAAGNASAVNRFKVQAGFFKSKGGGHRNRSSLPDPPPSSSDSNNQSGGRPQLPPVGPHHVAHHYAKSEPGGSTRFITQEGDDDDDNASSSFPQPFPMVPNLILEEFPEPDFPEQEPEPFVSDNDDDDDDDSDSVDVNDDSEPDYGSFSVRQLDAMGDSTDVPPPRSSISLQQAPLVGQDRGKRTFADVGVKSDVGVSSDVGARSDVVIASDVGVASNGGVNSDIGQVPMDIVGKLKKKSATEHERRVGEEEREAQRVSDLKRAWERRHELEANQAAERVRRRQTSTSPLPREDITRLENQLGEELLSPEILERKRISGTTVSMLKAAKNEGTPVRRAAECANQRTSFASYRQRLKPTQLRDDAKDFRSAKSDVGGYRRGQSLEMNSVRNRFINQKTSGQPQGSYGETRSDAGGSAPSFLANVKLRSTGGTVKNDKGRIKCESPHDDGQSSFEDDEFDYCDEASDYSDEELEWMRQQEEEFGSVSSDDEPKPRKMTYREKRELELKAERERKEAEEATKKQPERDVAALIRRRIAANKQKAALAEKEQSESTENIADMRSRLRKVTVEDNNGPRIPPSAPKQFVPKSPEPPSAAKKFLESTQELPPSAAKKLVETSPENHSQYAPVSVLEKEAPAPISPLAGRPDIPTETNKEGTGSGDSTSPSMHPPSMVASEVDSSSTNRTLEELLSGANHKQQLENEISAEGSVQREGAKKETSRIEEESAEEKVEPPQLTAVGAVEAESISVSSKSTKSMLNALLGQRLGPSLPASGGEPQPENDKEDVSSALMKMHFQQDSRKLEEETSPQKATGSRPALKDDPKYARYFRMLKVGMPMDVVKHAMLRDDMDPSVMDGDHNKPVGGVPLKEDPKYERYFKMLAVGLPLGAVKNAMERDGLDSAIMDGDHNLPAGAGADREQVEEDRPRDTHRRTRVHWETLRQVRASSLWAKIDNDPEVDEIVIDEEEFAELFQAELTPSQTSKSISGGSGKRKGAAVRVIESKRANNGGIILARLKMTYDDMADTVDRIDENAMTAEQMQNIIEYLPTSAERKALEAYMLEGDQDAAEKFDGLCECEKFMVAMMTVKHAKRKVRALLFKLQFESCLDSLEQDANVIETACDELKTSVRLRKLLGIVLNIGNRLNTAGAAGKRKAGAFSLNSLLKLSQAKAFDKKTTFLHYVVLVVQRNNELLLNFKDDLPTVLKADKIYWDQCISDLEDVENQLENVRRIALYQARLSPTYQVQKNKPKSDGDDESLSDASMTLEEEVEALRSSAIGLFTLGAIKKVSSLRDKVEATKVKFAKLLEYFGEEHRQDMQPHDLFSVIATFSRDFDQAKEKVLADAKKKKRDERMRRSGGKASRGSQQRASRTSIQNASTSPNAALQQSMNISADDSLTSPKSDAGVQYSSYSTSFSAEHHSSPQRRSAANSMQHQSTSMRQHSSTVNGMYETPKQQSTRKTRSSGGGRSSRSRDAAIRQKARMRRREGQGRNSSSTPFGPDVFFEEGRPPRSSEKRSSEQRG